MDQPRDKLLTVVLDRIRQGDEQATGELLNAAYADLRVMARNLFGGNGQNHTLHPTALVNELCVVLLKSPGPQWNDRNHFFRSAARAMRNLLIDHARAKRTLRRGGLPRGEAEGSDQAQPSLRRQGQRVSLDSLAADANPQAVDLLALDEAVTRLGELNERLPMIFELRFLVGLTVEQTAVVAEVAPRTVEKDSQFIRAWLQRELGS
jgi:RNA polymerase sigma factor (TIGR02999 family)